MIHVRAYRRPTRTASRAASDFASAKYAGSGRVARNIRTTLERLVPPDLYGQVAASLDDLGYVGYPPTLGLVYIDQRNFKKRVKSGAKVIVTWGRVTRPDEHSVVAEGTVVEVEPIDASHPFIISRQSRILVDFDGKRHYVRGYQIVYVVGR